VTSQERPEPLRGPDDQDVEALRLRIEDLSATLAAIRAGGVDAVLAGEAGQEQLYALVSADRPYRVIVEEMGESAFTVSPLGVVLYANRAMAELCGGADRRLVGSDAADLVPLEQRPAMAALLDVVPGETSRGELTMLGTDGRPVPVLVSSTGLDLDGSVVRCVVASDLTEVKAAEHTLAVSNAQLRRSNEELTQFAYVVSHDLSEPLRTITGFADLLQERYAGRLDSDADEFLDFITSGTARLRTLLDDLLLYTRVDTRPQPFSSVDLNQVLREVVSDLHARIEERGAEVVVDPLPTVWGDQVQLAQVFANLVRNSLMFVAEGVRPRVRVFAERGDRAWCVIVADNGIGIPEQYRGRVFKIFQRLHGRDDYPGTGVGLAVVEKIVRRHAGQIAVEDNPGGGTQMRVTVPDHAASPGEEDR
jgi:PAS domain S-box-containing protein